MVFGPHHDKQLTIAHNISSSVSALTIFCMNYCNTMSMLYVCIFILEFCNVMRHISSPQFTILKCILQFSRQFFHSQTVTNSSSLLQAMKHPYAVTILVASYLYTIMIKLTQIQSWSFQSQEYKLKPQSFVQTNTSQASNKKTLQIKEQWQFLVITKFDYRYCTRVG